MAARVCLGVEAVTPMIVPAAGRAVSVETPVAEGAAVTSVAAGVAVPASEGVGSEISYSSSFCCPLVLHGSV